MRKLFIVILSFMVFSASFCNAQDKPGTSFDGTIKGDPNVCQGTAKNMMTDKDVENMITQMLEKFEIRNRYIVMACSQVENCQATLYKGKPYILYNPEFLNKVKRLNFSENSLPGADDKDWETLTIIAHELGHHINNHLINPLPDARGRDMELEADQTAGFIIYLMGGTLSQAQSVYYNSNISEEGSYLYPPRKQRLESIAKGWNDAAKKYPKTLQPIKPLPINPNNNNQAKPCNTETGDYCFYNNSNGVAYVYIFETISVWYTTEKTTGYTYRKLKTIILKYRESKCMYNCSTENTYKFAVYTELQSDIEMQLQLGLGFKQTKSIIDEGDLLVEKCKSKTYTLR